MPGLVLDERLEMILTNNLSKSGSLRHSLATREEVDSGVALVVLLQHKRIMTCMLSPDARSVSIYSLWVSLSSANALRALNCTYSSFVPSRTVSISTIYGISDCDKLIFVWIIEAKHSLMVSRIYLCTCPSFISSSENIFLDNSGICSKIN